MEAEPLPPVPDLIFCTVAAAFFALSWAYARFCGRLR
jgi:hypothetical protein